MMKQQAMIIFTNHNYIVSQSLDYRLDEHVTSEQNFIDLLTQHGIEEVCNVNSTRSSDLELSSKQPNATFSELLN
jgi:hypothetical protein